jgi:hypothetical protein
MDNDMTTNITQWCEHHAMEVSPWRYEPELGKEMCNLCYNEYWDAENAEMWGQDLDSDTEQE